MWVSDLARTGKRLVSGARNRLFPTAEVSAWHRACRQARRVPRYTHGSIRLADYEIDYVDLLTLCPQWNDLFVRETLKVVLSDPSPRILDCGANIGLSVLYFKRLYPDAKVTAFEADPGIAEVLERNLKRNGCADVEVVRAAVWSHEGPVSFVHQGADSGAVLEVAGRLEGRSGSVRGIRLRNILARERISLLKLDVEGAEGEILRDCRDVLENVSTLLLELHEFDPRKRNTPAVLDLLSAAGFTFSIDELCPLPWRDPRAHPDSPFPGKHLCWASMVYAFRA